MQSLVLALVQESPNNLASDLTTSSNDGDILKVDLIHGEQLPRMVANGGGRGCLKDFNGAGQESGISPWGFGDPSLPVLSQLVYLKESLSGSGSPS